MLFAIVVGASGHPQPSARLLRACLEFPHGVDGRLAVRHGALLDAGASRCSFISSGRWWFSSRRGGRWAGCSRPASLLAPLSRLVIEHWFPGNPSWRGDQHLGIRLFRSGCVVGLGLRARHEGGRPTDRRWRVGWPSPAMRSSTRSTRLGRPCRRASVISNRHCSRWRSRV